MNSPEDAGWNSPDAQQYVFAQVPNWHAPPTKLIDACRLRAQLVGSHNAAEYEAIFARDFPHAKQVMPNPEDFNEYSIGSHSGEEGNCSCFNHIRFFLDSNQDIEMSMASIVRCNYCK